MRTYFNLTMVFVICGLWHGAAWAWLAYGLYNGVLMSLHRVCDRSLGGRIDALRATVLWKFVGWAATFWLVTAGLILIRMPSWETGGTLFRAMLGIDLFSTWSGVIPVWVPILFALGIAGHVLSGLRGKVCSLLEMPPAIRAAAYVAVVVLMIVLSPGVGKTFIYLAF